MKTLFILLFVAMCSQVALGQKIPAPAKEAFARSYPGVTNVKWDKEGQLYDATFTYDNRKMSVLYTSEGGVVETQVVIPITELPQAAQKYAAAKGKIESASRLIKVDGSVIYEAEVNGKSLLFNKRGDFIAEKQKKE